MKQCCGLWIFHDKMKFSGYEFHGSFSAIAAAAYDYANEKAGGAHTPNLNVIGWITASNIRIPFWNRCKHIRSLRTPLSNSDVLLSSLTHSDKNMVSSQVNETHRTATQVQMTRSSLGRLASTLSQVLEPPPISYKTRRARKKSHSFSLVFVSTTCCNGRC